MRKVLFIVMISTPDPQGCVLWSILFSFKFENSKLGFAVRLSLMVSFALCVIYTIIFWWFLPQMGSSLLSTTVDYLRRSQSSNGTALTVVSKIPISVLTDSCFETQIFPYCTDVVLSLSVCFSVLLLLYG